MTSKTFNRECYVWIWLPNQTKPVVAGKLTTQGTKVLFHYGQSYLKREDAIAIYPKELPLKAGLWENPNKGPLHGCLRDASPDAWGRRVILNKLLGKKGQDVDTADLSEMTYLMESGSDRIGALDFQASSTTYIPRPPNNTSLATLHRCATLIEKGAPLDETLAKALYHGTSIGGARPKAIFEGNGKKYIAKFSSSTDLYNIIKAEFMAMRLAAHCDLNVAKVKLVKAAKDVLLIERFDRTQSNQGWTRKLMLSALTLLGLDEMDARYASYQDLAEVIRLQFSDPEKTLKVLFARLVFNILCSNNDDHARNHAAFWNGSTLTLTPAYDICPQLRIGERASQAMAITDNNRSSRLVTALAGARHFLLDSKKAKEIIDAQIQTIRAKWDDVAKEALLTDSEYTLFKERLFLRSYAFEGYAKG